MRVLIAEDETIIRLDLRALLERAGHEVVGEARDGDEAVAPRRASPARPRRDGRQDAQARRHRGGAAHPRDAPRADRDADGVRPVQDLVERAAEAGVFGYLVKPFREADLLPAMTTARARFEELQARAAEAARCTRRSRARKVIERAKGILMARDGLTEQQAFERIRKASQIAGRPMRVIAEALLATFGDGGL